MYVIGSLKLVVNRLYNGVLQLLVWLLMAAGTLEAVWGFFRYMVMNLPSTRCMR